MSRRTTLRARHVPADRVLVGVSHGFTLLEIVVTLAIIGVVVTMAVTNYSQWANRTRLRTTTEELASNLNLARVAAISRNTTVQVNIDPLSPSTIGSYSASTSGGASVIALTTPAKGVNLTGGTPYALTFNGLGLSSGGTVVLEDRGGTRYQVTVSTGGLVSYAKL